MVAGTNGNDELLSGSLPDSIFGYGGDDSLYGNGGADTLVGGKDDDYLVGGKGADTFVYAFGDGNDTIADYQASDKIKLTSSVTPKFKISGNNAIVTIGTGSNKGTITILNAVTNGEYNKPITWIDANGEEHVYPQPIVISEDGKTVRMLGAYTKDSFDVATDIASLGADSSDIITIDAADVTHDLDITGNKNANKIIATEEDDYISGGSGKDTIIAGDGNDTLYGGKGNDSLKGGSGEDAFVYNVGDGNDVITDYESGEVIKIRSGSVSSVGITGNDYIITVGSGKITLKDAKDKFVQIVDEYGRTTWYPAHYEEYVKYNGNTRTVTLTKAYPTGAFDVTEFENGFAGTVKVIDASAVEKALVITGNEKANDITGTTDKDTIYGGAGADTIYGGEGNDVLSGGDGADVFSYSRGDGNDKIVDYSSEDKIRITGDYVTNTTESGNDVVFTLSNKSKITVVGGGDVEGGINYSDIYGVHTFPSIPSPVVFSSDGKTASITAGYTDYSFSVADYKNYKKTLITIDATQVNHDLNIIGNDKPNVIYATNEDDNINGGAGKDTLYGYDGNDVLRGGTGNDNLNGGAGKDTLWGDSGDDTLFGGTGADVFVYNGDGNDVIRDYAWSIDKIVYQNGVRGDVDNVEAIGNDVVFTMANGNELTLTNAAGKAARIVNSSGEILKEYRGSR